MNFIKLGSGFKASSEVNLIIADILNEAKINLLQFRNIENSWHIEDKQIEVKVSYVYNITNYSYKWLGILINPFYNMPTNNSIRFYISSLEDFKIMFNKTLRLKLFL